MSTHTDQLQQLSQLLKSSRRKTATADAIQGMLAAAACGPTVVRPATWLRYVFPTARAADFVKMLKDRSGEQLVNLLLSVYDDLLFSIRQATFTPWFGAGKQPYGFAEARPWCTGFLYGISFHGEAWSDQQSDNLATLLAPILYISDPEGVGSEMTREEAEVLAEKEQVFVEAIRVNVPKIYDFWNLGPKAAEEKKRVLG